MNKKTIILSVCVLLGILVVAWLLPDREPIAQSVTAAVTPALPMKRPVLQACEVENPHLRAFLVEYERELRELMHSSEAPGAALAVVQDTSVIFLKGFGLQAAGSMDSVNTETVFR